MSQGENNKSHEDEVHEHDLGLVHDLPLLISRRRALGAIVVGVGSAATLAACGSGGSSTTTTTAASTDASSSAGSTSTTASSGETEIPEETGGPYPGDGTNGPNVLTESGVVRKNITTSFGGSKGTAEGVPTTIEFSLIDVAGGGGPLAGAALYLWHCSREGAYSMYDASIADQNYLRGVQVADKQGKLSFETILPACYSGRWPHMHFEIYKDEAAATEASTKLRTSQLALPKDLCDAVYGTAEGYDQSVTNLAQVSLDTDMVFSDGYSSQLPSYTGSVDKGYALKLNVGV